MSDPTPADPSQPQSPEAVPLPGLRRIVPGEVLPELVPGQLPLSASAPRRITNLNELPTAVLNEVGQRLRAGARRPEILAYLASAGFRCRARELESWERHGYQNWLAVRRQLELIAQMKRLWKNASELPEGPGTAIALQAAGERLLQVLGSIDPEGLNNIMTGQPAEYARVISAWARLFEAAARLEFTRSRITQASADRTAGRVRVGLTTEDLAQLELALNLM